MDIVENNFLKEKIYKILTDGVSEDFSLQFHVSDSQRSLGFRLKDSNIISGSGKNFNSMVIAKFFSNNAQVWDSITKNIDTSNELLIRDIAMIKTNVNESISEVNALFVELGVENKD